MSDNVVGTDNLHVNVGVSPMNLGPEFGSMPELSPEAKISYHIGVMSAGGNSIVLTGYEAVLAAVAILDDALQRDIVLKAIKRPSRGELEELRAIIERIGYPHKTESDL